jgi:hypothetical protein
MLTDSPPGKNSIAFAVDKISGIVKKAEMAADVPAET